MSGITDYKVLEAVDSATLNTLMATEIAAGWQPYGNGYVGAQRDYPNLPLLVQPMTKGVPNVSAIASATITTLTTTDVDAGASGTAGSVDIFPATGSKGKAHITAADQTGDTTVSIVVGAMAAARTLTVRDPGAAASFLTTTDATAAATTATAAQISRVAVVTPGTGEASKAVILGAALGFAATMTAPTVSVDGFTFSFTSGSATPGSCRAIVGAATGFTSMSSGSIAGVRGVTTLGGAHSAAAYAYGVQGKLVTGSNTVTGKTAAAVYAQFDVTGGVMTSGDSAGVVSLITGATALGGNGSGQFPGLDGIYVENVGGGNVHSVLRSLGGANYVFDLTDGGVAPYILAAGSGGTGSAGYAAGAGIPTKVLKCFIAGAAMYVPCYSTNA